MRSHEHNRLLAGLLLAAVLILIFVAFVNRKTRTNVRIEEFEKEVIFNGVKYEIHGVLAAPTGPYRRLPRVILLHDKRFSADTWKQTGTLHFLAANGHEVNAIHLPGYGGSRVQGKYKYDDFLSAVATVLEVNKNTLWIGPGLGGGYMLHFFLKDVSHLTSSASGAIFLTPSNILDFDRLQYTAFMKVLPNTFFAYCGTPHHQQPGALVRYNQASDNVESLNRGAASPYCYMDQPRVFHNYLLKAIGYMTET